MQGHDTETRERLLSTAERLFAARGFSKVTIREICTSARANVAAVNYHFGGKKGLYDEVVRSAIKTMQSTTDSIREAGSGRSADEQLAAYISIFLKRVVAARDSWIHQLMMRELSDPTPALDLVLKKVVQPRMKYLRAVIASMFGCDATDPRVERCAMSVQSQCLALLMHPVAALRPKSMNDRELDLMAQHIAQFSLGGLRAIAKRGG
ncbi:MAG: TetR/AcrR family transcriptional regulator [Acidobacteria bacterium]|nr:MAG: TetR/AcrR family transcriptional regulator [Acidobacteriota bacterium]